ncbi:MAG: TolC family protein [Isosphaeraceae bacterium]|nr:TolC family protein [Isosphaeraceae bacterium]
MKSHTINPIRTARPDRRVRSFLLFAVVVLGQAGCGREFFREWANQDVSEAVFEKTRDPRWRLDLFSHTPPAMSRFADPYDPDNPPAPPDDFAAAALSPVPQNPNNRLIVPVEGTGYLTMLEQWLRERPEDDKDTVGGPVPAESMPAGMGRPEVDPGSTTSPPPPAGDAPSPFVPAPGALPGDIPPPPPIPGGAAPRANSGPAARSMTPNTRAGVRPTGTGVHSPREIAGILKAYDPKIQASAPTASKVGSSARSLKDPAVGRTALQQPAQTTPESNRPMLEPPPAIPSATRSADRPQAPSTPPPPDQLQTPRAPLDPDPRDINLAAPVNPRPDLDPNQAEAIKELEGLLAPREIPFYEAEAAGLPRDSRPYVVSMEQAFVLGLINSRQYQFQLENLYLAALPVTLNRFNFTPQFFAGLTPSTGILGPAGVSISPSVNPGTNFFYRTIEAGGQASVLNLGTVAAVGKVFDTGGRILASFASQVVFNFTGTRPAQPSVNGFLPLQFVQPFLRNAGRAVTLEGLTQAERGLLYQARVFARFRQEFVVATLVGGAAGQQFGAGAATGGFGAAANDPSIGFLRVVQDLQTVENDVRNVVTFEQFLKVYQELIKGESSGLAQLQVDQINQNLQNARRQLIQDTVVFRNNLDSFKIQLGLPPDVPMIVDRSISIPFRKVFESVEDWSRNARRELADLDAIAARLPKLEDVVIDGRSALTVAQEEDVNLEDLMLAAERVALENRLDLMNARANLYDTWRQIRIAANQLKGVFNVQLTNQILTPPNTTNPFAFVDQAKNFQLVLNAELPLVRMAERNTFVGQLVAYQRQRRVLMSNEDALKLTIRQDIRALHQQYRFFEIAKRNYVLLVRQKDQSFENIIQPPAGTGSNTQAATQTLNLIGAQNGVIAQQNALLQNWLQYQIARLQLYRDLGTMPFDEWEAFYELFPATVDNAVRPGLSPAAPGSQPGPFDRFGSGGGPTGAGEVAAGIGRP